MSRSAHQNRVDSLARFLIYILGYRPDEFGLVPDKKGYVTFKELLQAIHEETDWRYVRDSHINEVLLGKDRDLFQAGDKRIRVLDRKWRSDFETSERPAPGLLFTPVRRKAHPVVMEKGLKANEGKYIILSPDKEMALRIGRRRDQSPVLLEIPASQAEKKGVLFQPFGCLYLSPAVPSRFISGPPVSREILERQKVKEAKKETIQKEQSDFAPGTFVLNAERDPDPRRKAKGKKRKGWKENARKMRRRKR